MGEFRNVINRYDQTATLSALWTGFLHFTSDFPPLDAEKVPDTEKAVTNPFFHCIITPVLKDTTLKGVDRLKITLESAHLPETEVIIRGDATSDEVISLLQLLRGRNSGKLVLYKEDEQYIVDISDIVFLETGGSHVTVFTQNQTYEAKQKLYELKEQLAAYTFAQINKSTLVNISHVKCIQAEFSGNYLIKLKNRKEKLTLSRKFFREFKEKI